MVGWMDHRSGWGIEHLTVLINSTFKMAYWGRCVALLFVLYHLGAKMHQIYHVCTDALHARLQCTLHFCAWQCTLDCTEVFCTAVERSWKDYCPKVDTHLANLLHRRGFKKPLQIRIWWWRRMGMGLFCAWLIASRLEERRQMQQSRASSNW